MNRTAGVAPSEGPSFTDEELAARFTKTHGGPNSYYACKACGEDVPGLRNLLVEHAATHGVKENGRG